MGRLRPGTQIEIIRRGQLIVATVEPGCQWLDHDVETVSYEVDGQTVRSTVVAGHYRLID